MKDKLIKWLMLTYLVLIIVDMSLTYYAVRYLGAVELSLIIRRWGLVPGIGLTCLLLFFIAWLLWKVRSSPLAGIISVSGLSILCIVELATLTQNAIELLS